MKKPIISALAVALLVTALAAQTASAHENGDNGSKSKGNNGIHFGFFHNMDLKFFNHSNINKEDRKDNNSGLGRVTKVSGDMIVAESVFGKTTKTLTINTDSNTTFMLQNGNEMKLSQIENGDIISFKGDVTADSDSNFTVDASAIKDWGDFDLKSRAKITGTVKSVDDDNQSLVITTDSGETISVNSTDRTMIKDDNGDKTTFTNIDAGSKITLKGFWNSIKDLFTAFKIKITS